MASPEETAYFKSPFPFQGNRLELFIMYFVRAYYPYCSERYMLTRCWTSFSASSSVQASEK